MKKPTGSRLHPAARVGRVSPKKAPVGGGVAAGPAAAPVAGVPSLPMMANAGDDTNAGQDNIESELPS